MIISGHQPCYLPWLGVFHKLELCDVFVYMDTVQYLTNDWNNRNKIRVPEGELWLTVPIDKRKTTNARLDRVVISSGNTENPRKNWQRRHWEAIRRNYSGADYFHLYGPELEQMYLSTVWTSLSTLCWAQFQFLLRHFQQDKKTIVKMSEVFFEGRKSDLILSHCLKFSADGVVLGKNGQSYIELKKFKENNIRVYFQNYCHPVYDQRYTQFVPRLSALDLLLNHGPRSREILLSENVTYSDLQNGNHWVNSNESGV